MRKWILLLLGFRAFCMDARYTESIFLSGTGSDDTVLWEFFCTAGRNSGKWTAIPVPSNWEFQGFGQFTYGHDTARINESGLYRHRFTAPAEWKDREVHLVFEGVMTDTEVKVNGRKAGEVHQGGYYRFSYSVGRLLKFGDENLLEVTVHKASANKTVEAAERKADFWVYGGIYRPVHLDAFPRTHIERVAIDARCDGTFAMDVLAAGDLRGAEVTAQVKTLHGLPFGRAMRMSAGRDKTIRLSSKYEDPALWSSEFPHRYQVEVSIERNGETLHSVTEKFGFRTVEVRPGDGIYINNTKIRFKGVNRHTHWPESGRTTCRAISLLDAGLIKEMNMNAVRMSHYPPDSHFLDVCDSLGLYVIDELTAWQYPPYDTETGRLKVRQLVTRDVNHPCIVLWANGNEGGFNFELTPEYAKYDIQRRHVIHPWLEEEATNTYHYPSYGVGAGFLFGGNKVFFPTEAIHGLYDGGHGAGLEDFWQLMERNPLSAGCFLWDLVDAGVVRGDRGGELDTDGNHGADGILGPYREKEGSFFAVKEIWSPVQIEGTAFLPPSFDGTLRVRNGYHFTQLSQCSFSARWVKFDFLAGTTATVETPVSVPDVPPGLDGILRLDLPRNMADFDALYLTAVDPHGKELYTWTRTLTPAGKYAASLVDTLPAATAVEEHGPYRIYTAGDARLGIDTSKGVIGEISVNGRRLSLANGPRYTSGDLTLHEVTQITEDGLEKTRCIFSLRDNPRGGMRNVIQLALLPSGWIEVSYRFDVGGHHDHIGLTFDYPEEKVHHIKWLGYGPYRVWKNRRRGVSFNIWEKAYNNTVTGESWDYPEFKGYHAGLYAADLTTDEGTLRLVAASEDLFLHLFTPDKPEKRNNDNTLGIFPDGQLSILNAVSPVGTKFKPAKDTGPQGQPNYYLSSGHASPLQGTFYLKFIPSSTH
jgi:hypothetical protein